jgi:hypothetical protein
MLAPIIKPPDKLYNMKLRLMSDMTELEFSLDALISCSKARTNPRAAAAGFGLGFITMLTKYGSLCVEQTQDMFIQESNDTVNNSKQNNYERRCRRINLVNCGIEYRRGGMVNCVMTAS